MGSALARFYYDFQNDKEKLAKMISTATNSILLRGLIILGIALIFSDYIGSLFSQAALKDFGSYGYLCVIVGINRAINLSAVTIYRNEEKAVKYVTVNMISGLLRAIFQVVGVLYMDMSFIGYLYGNLIGSSLVTFYILLDTYKVRGFSFNRTVIKDLNKFSAPLFQYEVLSWGLMFLDRFFLEKDPSALGIYDNALKFAIGIQLIVQGLIGAAQPEIFRYMAEGIEKRINEIKSVSNMLIAQTQIIILITIIPTMLFISFLYETELQLSAGLISIIFIRFIIRAQYNAFSIPVLFMKKTKVFFYINSLSLIVNLMLNYLLIPIYSYYGAIIAFMSSSLLQLILIYTFQKRTVSIPWNLNKVLVYPLIIIAISIILEIIKVKLSLNIYITSLIQIILMALSLITLYKKDIMKSAKSISKRFTI
ncbi:MAG TPA: polysaccharide biosynthesis C-terminal domain-containing protein [Lentimicrobium sp.]|nr:polysaccharide biosynthesis C-terminal domain-containing protein [Lentimicrobium sp.]